MAIYLSDLMTNGASVIRSENGGGLHTVTANIRIPAGTVLTSADKILVARFPAGTEFDRFHGRFPDLDSSTALTLDIGYDRPVVDPRLPYNADTNPYIDGAIATADVDFFEEDSTIGQAGGLLNLLASGFTVATSPESAGIVDVSITPVVSGAATAADGTIEITLYAFLTSLNQAQGEFSGANSYDYTSTLNLD